MVIILVKNTTYTEMVIIDDGENYHSCAEAQNVFNLKQVYIFEKPPIAMEKSIKDLP